MDEQFDPFLLIEILLLLIEFNLRKLRKNPYFLTYYSIFKFNKMSRKIYNYNIPWIMGGGLKSLKGRNGAMT